MFQAGSGRYLMQPGVRLVCDDSAVLLRPAGSSSTGRREQEHGALSLSPSFFFSLTAALSLRLSAKFMFLFISQPKASQSQKTCQFALDCDFIQLKTREMTQR